jgi:hypothetical protein
MYSLPEKYALRLCGNLNKCRISVLTAVVTKNIVFWDITLCWLLKVSGRFGGTFRLLLQALLNCFHAGFLLSLFFYLESESDVLSKRRFTFNGLHVITEKTKTSTSTEYRIYKILAFEEHIIFWGVTLGILIGLLPDYTVLYSGK